MHFIICISIYVIYNMHFIMCISIYAFHDKHFIICFSWYALNYMHFIICISLYTYQHMQVILCISCYACHFKYSLNALYNVSSILFYVLVLCKQFYTFIFLVYNALSTLYYASFVTNIKLTTFLCISIIHICFIHTA